MSVQRVAGELSSSLRLKIVADVVALTLIDKLHAQPRLPLSHYK